MKNDCKDKAMPVGSSEYVLLLKYHVCGARGSRIEDTKV